ncbi:MAG TPA: helix-turn-helix domain-containing protein [Chloroflexota bacterium]|nr:helix-turn-helix domain-containing protein [Chloroflexota bacterium]
MQKTRRQILDLLKLRGSATLEELSREIGLSSVTIRAHLSVLERDDLITSEEVRGRVGRPHFLYSLTESAQDQFPVSYDIVAHRFLEAFRSIATEEQRELLVRVVAERWAAEKGGRLQDKGLEERVAEVARIRSEEGAMAEWQMTGDGYLLRQHHCTAGRISGGHPEVCQAELEYLRRLLGVYVERVESPHDGQTKCSYLVKP